MNHCAFCDAPAPEPASDPYDAFLREFELVWHSLESSEWRRGQCLMNVLFRTNPQLAEKVSQSDFDPFYIDARIDACLTWLKANLT